MWVGRTERFLFHLRVMVLSIKGVTQKNRFVTLSFLFYRSFVIVNYNLLERESSRIQKFFKSCSISNFLSSIFTSRSGTIPNQELSVSDPKSKILMKSSQTFQVQVNFISKSNSRSTQRHSPTKYPIENRKRQSKASTSMLQIRKNVITVMMMPQKFQPISKSNQN